MSPGTCGWRRPDWMRSRRAWRSSPTTSPTSTPRASSRAARCSRTCSTRTCASLAASALRTRCCRPACARHRRARRGDREAVHPGQRQQTENALDVAIKGRGFFQILMPDGAHRLHARRQRSRSTTRASWSPPSGYVVQPGITIPEDAQSVTIGARTAWCRWSSPADA